MKLISRSRVGILIALIAVAACSAGSDDSRLAPGKTTFSHRGDTVIATSSGRMPDSLVHHLVEELRIGVANGADEEMFGRVDEIAVSRDGHMLVLDGSVPVVRLYDSTGVLVRQVGRKGGGPGEYGHINGLAALPDGGWAIWDASGSRINRYSPDGTFLKSARAPVSGTFSSNSLLSDSGANLYLEHALRRTTPGGKRPSGLIQLDSALNVRDTISATEAGGEPVQLVAHQDGATAIYALPFSPQNITVWSTHGHFITGQQDPYELHSVTPTGAPLIIKRHIPRIEVPEEVRKEQREQTTWLLRLSVPDWEWNGPEVPHVKPAIANVQLGAHDRIWVQLNTESEPIPDDEITVSDRPNAPPTRHWRDAPARFDVFEPDGTYLGETAIPGNVRVMKVDGDHVWAITWDEDDVPYVLRLRVEPPLGASR